MDSNARSLSSGVRNLRAMFEAGNSNTEDSTSPPRRGRSPAGESIVSNGSATPLSTVRTNFVAVERSGQLKRINGDGVVEGKADLKVGTANKNKPKDGNSEALANGKTGPQGNSMASETTVDHLEKLTSSGEGLKSAVLPADPKGKVALASSRAANEQPPTRADEPKGAIASLSAAEIPLPDTPDPTEKGKTKMTTKLKSPAPAPLKSSSSEEGKEKSVPTISAAIANLRENVSRPSPAPISVSKDAVATKSTANAPTQARAQAAKPPAKLPRTPTTPNKPSHSTTATAKPRAPPATTAESMKSPTKKPSRASMVPQTASAFSAAPKPHVPAGSSSTTTLPKPALQSSPRSKANPKSPTRPARLPTSIIAPTASSAAKTSNNPSSRPYSRESSNFRRHPPTIQKTEKPSPTHPTTIASVRRQPSRPSLPERSHSRGTAVGRKSLSGSTAAPDEGFLARMMRPTASSASKTHEKLQEKLQDKVHDKAHERGDAKVVRKVKSVIKGTTKSSRGVGATTGEVKKDEHYHKTEEVKTNDPGDAKQGDTSVAVKENEKPTVHQEEEKAPVVEGTSQLEEGDNRTTEDHPPASEVVPELPEVSPVVAAAG